MRLGKSEYEAPGSRALADGRRLFLDAVDLVAPECRAELNSIIPPPPPDDVRSFISISFGEIRVVGADGQSPSPDIGLVGGLVEDRRASILNEMGTEAVGQHIERWQRTWHLDDDWLADVALSTLLASGGQWVSIR